MHTQTYTLRNNITKSLNYRITVIFLLMPLFPPIQASIHMQVITVTYMYKESHQKKDHKKSLFTSDIYDEWSIRI